MWPAQMLCVTPGSSSGFRSPRSPALPSPRHHAQTTFILGIAVCHRRAIRRLETQTYQRRPRKPGVYARELTQGEGAE